MSKMTLYHGSRDIVERPICSVGRDNLDFGKGFYLTDIRLQAENWAKRIAASHPEQPTPLINIYEFDRDGFISQGNALIFDSYNKDWLDFIVKSRRGHRPWESYDYVEGGIANDRVIDTVFLYIDGIIDFDTALRRLAMHQPNNQICLLNQVLTDRYLKFIGYERI